MNPIENLIAHYNGCSPDDIHRKVIQTLFRHIRELEDIGIHDLAARCYVSAPTISRLCRRLGYRSFIECKTELVRFARNYETRNRFVPLNAIAAHGNEPLAYLSLMARQLQDFTETIDLDQLDRLAREIHACRRVSLYSYGIQFSEPHFQEDLLMAGHTCNLFSMREAQLVDVQTLDETCMLILILPVVSEQDVARTILETAKARKARILLLTDSKTTGFLKYADHSYCFDGIMGILDDYRFAMFINLLSITYRNLFMT